MKKFIGGYQPETVDAIEKIGQAANKATCSMEEMKNALDKTKVEEYEPTQHYQYMKNMISGLVGLELRDANQHYPLFASNHEAVAVIFEELQETQEDLRDVREALKEIWGKVRKDEDCTAVLKLAKLYAQHAAYEAMQVSAMCQKAIDSERERKK